MKYFRIIATYVIRTLLYIFCVFPIKNNRLIFNSFMWKQYSCNPKYISEYLLKNYPNKFEIIWAFNSPEKYEYLEALGIKVIKSRSILFYYYRMTAKISICNATMAAEIPKRKGQYWINTWHGGGGGYKKEGYGNAMEFRPRLEMSQTDLFCASSQTSLNNTIRIAFRHNGDFFPGTPRNDMLVNGDRLDIKRSVYDFLNIENDKKVLLYAPTYREGTDARHHSNNYDYGLDFDILHNALEKKYGGSWIIAIRFHQKIESYNIINRDFIIDATKYPDMQELLASVDALVTDYSSSIWDFTFTYKPCFLFCSDLDDYIQKRGFNKPIEEWGLSIARSNSELYNNILKWDADKYKESMDNQHIINGSFEDGTATKRMCELIERKCFSE